MARETKIGLLVGLAFIVLFGVILSERGARQATRAAYVPAGGGEIHEIIAEGDGSEIDPFALSDEEALEESVGIVAVNGPRDQDLVYVSTPDTQDSTEGTVAVMHSAPSSSPEQTYVIQRGDNLTRIARKVYGPGSDNLWRKIYDANRQRISNPRRLRIGRTIVIPTLATPRRAVETPPPTARESRPVISVSAKELGQMLRKNSEAEVRAAVNRTYVVKPGDSFWMIARKIYGDSSKAKLLMAKNRHLVSSPSRLRVGQRILLLDEPGVLAPDNGGLVRR